MLRSADPSQSTSANPMRALVEPCPVNAMGGLDDFVTAEPTPKMESRRGWRRRRVRRGKS